MKFMGQLFLVCYLSVSIFGFTLANEDDKIIQFHEFMKKYNKSYSKVEFTKRFKIFVKNLEFIEKHNHNGTADYKLGMNKFGDLTLEEYTAKYLGRINQQKIRTINTPSDIIVSDSLDWREKGAVTPVRDQKQCGGCWAFSALASLEGANFVAHGKLLSLSVENLIDCDTKSSGCYGGLERWAYAYIKTAGGVCLEADYPFVGSWKKLPCLTNCTKYAAISDFVAVPKNEDNLAAALNGRPIASALNAAADPFRFYKSGVLTAECNADQLTHAVTVVGYGTDGQNNYWQIKNSFGLSWGEQGYIRLGKSGFGKDYGDNGQCGISVEPYYPIPK